VLSLGTNTVRILVVRDRADGELEQIDHRQTGTRLGEGLCDGGRLAPVAVERTLAVVAQYAAVARDYGASLACIATSAVRRADDGAAFAERIRATAGVPLHILSGADEAAASYRGATYGVPHDGRRVAVLDIGGGSTECALGCDGALLDVRSIEIGSVRIAERFPELLGASPGRPAREAARAARLQSAQALVPLRALAPIDELRCVAGTPLTIAAVVSSSHVDEVSGSMLARDEIDATIDRLLDLNVDERRSLPGMLAQRADIIVGGALVLSAAMDALGTSTGLLEANDLLLGYLVA